MQQVTSFRQGNALPYVTIEVQPEEDEVTLTLADETFTWPNHYAHRVGTELTFTATPGNLDLLHSDPVEFRWDMGDGIVRYGPTINYTYVVANPDTTVRLLMVDSRGRRATAFKVLNLVEFDTTNSSLLVATQAVVLS